MPKPSAFQRLLEQHGATAEEVASGRTAPTKSDGASAPKAPTRTIRIPPSGFAASYAERPSEPLPVGLCLVSEQVVSRAQAVALREAWAECPEPSEELLRADVYATSIMVGILCRAVTLAHDCTRLFFAEMPEVQLRAAFTVETIRRLWEAYGRMASEESPLSREADDAALGRLGEALAAGVVGKLHEAHQRRVRRLLGELSDEMGIG